MLVLIAAIGAQSLSLPPAFQPMDFLIGHCWEGKLETGETDAHCFDTIYDGQHVRDRHEVSGDEHYRGETIYSREGQAVSFTYWNSLGGVSRGTLTNAGGRLDFGVERHRTKDGHEFGISTHWLRDGPDAYRVVTASAELASMNGTVTYRRVPPPISVRSERAANASRTLIHEAIVAAPPAAAWAAIATAEGWKRWAVPTAWLDGDLLETSYSKGAVRGDDTTIRQQILLRVPERLIAFRTIKAPKGFPNFESFRQTTHWIELEPAGEGRTRVRLVSSGYADDEAGRQLADFFTGGNRLSLERLRRSLETGPIDWAAEEGSRKR